MVLRVLKVDYTNTAIHVQIVATAKKLGYKQILALQYEDEKIEEKGTIPAWDFTIIELLKAKNGDDRPTK